MNSKCTIPQFMRPKSYVIQFLEKVKATVLLNLQIKKRVNAPFKKCLGNLLAVDKLKWIMQVKGIEINKINLNLQEDSHLKEVVSGKTPWTVNMVHQLDMVPHHQWEELHLTMEDMVKDLHQEWWVVLHKTLEKIWITVAECHLMAKECMDKVVHLQVIMEWIEEEVTVEWVVWEWVEAITPIYHNINNMVELTNLDNMVVALH